MNSPISHPATGRRITGFLLKVGDRGYAWFRLGVEIGLFISKKPLLRNRKPLSSHPMPAPRHFLTPRLSLITTPAQHRDRYSICSQSFVPHAGAGSFSLPPPSLYLLSPPLSLPLNLCLFFSLPFTWPARPITSARPVRPAGAVGAAGPPRFSRRRSWRHWSARWWAARPPGSARPFRPARPTGRSGRLTGVIWCTGRFTGRPIRTAGATCGVCVCVCVCVCECVNV